MISSLANFLVLILYHGGHPQRIAWTLLMFTMGSVGIARVAIEKDRAYSFGYAGILGIVAFVAMLRFVNSPIFSAFILVVIGYLSDRIVHDCTLIDESVDSSGQGLVDSGRLFVKKQMEAPDDPAHDQGQTGSVKTKAGKGQNQPGRTVMYLALAALPMFGLGQFMLHNDEDTWRRAQWLLAIYLFSSLSLLVTTSFLGLRRYLRQRRVDMPKDVSVAWLVGGLAMIAVILTIAYVAPLPGQALASFELPNFLDSPGGLSASKFGWGDEAADKSNPDAATTQNDPNSQDKDVHSVQSQQGAPPGDSGDGNREDGPAGSQKGGEKPAGGGDQKGQSQDESQSKSPSENGSEPSDQQGSQSGSEDSQSDSDSSDSSQQSQSKSSDSESESESESSQQSDAESEPKSDDSADSSNQEQTDAKQSPSDNQQESEAPQQESSSPPPPSAVTSAIPMLSGLIRIIVFLALITVIAVFLWLNRDAIAAWLRALFRWNRTTKSEEESLDEFIQAQTQVPPRSFASYRNPFGNEEDPRRIVVITFQALEAWSREQGATRGKDETPSEFVRRIAGSLPQVSIPASQLVDSYNRIVYGRGNASDKDLSAAKRVWKTMSAV